MKRPIFILTSILCVCAVRGAVASDSLEEEELITPAPQVASVDNVQISDEQYITETLDEFAKTRARVDELLIPCETSGNLWTNDGADDNSSLQVVMMGPMSMPSTTQKPKARVETTSNMGFSMGEQSYYGETVYIINNFLQGGASDNVSESDGIYNGARMRAEYADCPFGTPRECAIWVRKPVISETVSPRSKVLRDDVMCGISSAIEDNPNISANDKEMAPLLNRYKVLMRASQSCCTGGITYKLKKAGASQGLIYKFLSDDANFSGFGKRCLVMSDDEIDNTDKYEATSATIADVRNGCLCKSKANFKALLAPFEQLYAEYPNFARAPFEYRHYDGVGRAVVDSVNADVQNVLNQLEMCP